ncbi:MAG: hypothetical protein CSA49_02320 [Gammaproteobacteria bacterium]|nr:MAG: hypothetical protein CSA49_02320 [Gammaproteobacteria bacterium]
MLSQLLSTAVSAVVGRFGSKANKAAPQKGSSTAPKPHPVTLRLSRLDSSIVEITLKAQQVNNRRSKSDIDLSGKL